jgi:hypothetical protein
MKLGMHAMVEQEDMRTQSNWQVDATPVNLDQSSLCDFMP